LKLTLSLPNGAVVTLETSTEEHLQELLHLAFKELPLELLRSSHPAQEGRPEEEKGRDGLGLREFSSFCRGLAPRGDMRRLVTAAEGARRFLGMAEVSAKELPMLFEAAGWPKPRDFTQTLRNAGRSKFGWLERVPGRQGYYTVTEKGKQEVLGERGASP
jgi:hypothetical protein